MQHTGFTYRTSGIQQNRYIQVYIQVYIVCMEEDFTGMVLDMFHKCNMSQDGHRVLSNTAYTGIIKQIITLLSRWATFLRHSSLLIFRSIVSHIPIHVVRSDTIYKAWEN